MAWLLLRRALSSLSISLTSVGCSALRPSSVPAAFSASARYCHPQNTMDFRSAFLLPSSSWPPAQQTSGLKTKGVLKKRCKDCYIVKRRGRLYVYCKSHGRHKQRLA
ncbi:hypothetical protein GDO78_020615 [Eleutherodactylus coqui]|uniref:Ribosomal protein n=1 Tax=Eleutherodactylus coqui TaxID=57060 RepID=A0A8J6ECC6_ELECQ|nr:hypothetical protein GDO78_020615 [Eleutherodactylus coqui]